MTDETNQALADADDAAKAQADADAAAQVQDVPPVRVITTAIIQTAGIRNGMSAEQVDALIEASYQRSICED